MPDPPDQALPGAETTAAPAPNDLVASLPAPVLRLLVLFAVPISVLRAGLEVLFWKPERRIQSWLMLLLWWAACFGSVYAFAWLVPPLVFLPLLPLARLRIGPARSRVHPTPAQPATSETLLHTINDLNKVQALLPPSPLPGISHWYARFRQLGAWRLVRGLVVVWAVWIALGLVLGNRTLVALTGSAVLLIPSPPLAHVVNLASKSLAARRTAALLFLLVFGSPDRDYKLGSPLGWVKSKWARSRQPSTALAFEPVEQDDHDAAPADRAGNPIYFRFEIHENQRWWMGLDWTSALLPQERPSWCDSHLFPVSPPQAFTLPAPSGVDFPSPTKSEPRAMVRRTATWRWLDDDWNIVRAGQGAAAAVTRTATTAASPVEDPTPASRPSSGIFSDDSQARSPSMAEQAFVKGLGRLKGVPIPGASASPAQSPVKTTDLRRARTDSEASSNLSHTSHADDTPSPYGSPIAESDEATDADGWVYGDNKWESMTSKGGLGKFTRRRRWQRRAVCVESVHRIAESTKMEETGSGAATPVAERPRSGSAPGLPLKAPPAPPPAPVLAPAPAPTTTIPASSSARDDALRQRLKKAMGNMGA